MKAYLMFKERDFKITEHKSYGKKDLMADLELDYILKEMSQEDEIIYETCKEAILTPLLSKEDIYYRQETLSDVLRNPVAVKALYDITIETEKKTKKNWRWFSRGYLPSVFSNGVKLLDLYIDMLLKLRIIADNNIDDFQSEGFKTLLSMLIEELNDEYIKGAKDQLKDLGKSDGTFISSKVGSYLHGVDYTLRKKQEKGSWRKWFFAPSYKLAKGDERGAKDIGERRKRSINEATNVLGQATEQLEGFFSMLRRELSFYVGCFNLSETLKESELPICLPNILEVDSYDRNWKQLYDVSLALSVKTDIIGNDISAKDKNLYMITGANQGGKTTYLRAIGQAQLMAQSGMFVCAKEYSAPIRDGIFSHFRREEDTSHTSGKLDEELVRMSEIVDHLNENSLLLANESFAATNEREGSEINNQITRALIKSKVEVFSVTHLYTYASSFSDETGIHYLRAERLDDGTRTFKVVEGKPLITAYGEDLYHKIFDD